MKHIYHEYWRLNKRKWPIYKRNNNILFNKCLPCQIVFLSIQHRYCLKYKTIQNVSMEIIRVWHSSMNKKYNNKITNVQKNRY